MKFYLLYSRMFFFLSLFDPRFMSNFVRSIDTTYTAVHERLTKFFLVIAYRHTTIWYPDDPVSGRAYVDSSQSIRLNAPVLLYHFLFTIYAFNVVFNEY
jgi:hypothetical protein